MPPKGKTGFKDAKTAEQLNVNTMHNRTVFIVAQSGKGLKSSCTNPIARIPQARGSNMPAKYKCVRAINPSEIVDVSCL